MLYKNIKILYKVFMFNHNNIMSTIVIYCNLKITDNPLNQKENFYKKKIIKQITTYEIF